MSLFDKISEMLSEEGSDDGELQRSKSETYEVPTSDEVEIVVVDDEKQVADMYSKWLELEDYPVRTAYDGEGALEKIDRDVDVVFLDRRMPGMSGDEVLEEIEDRDYECQVAMLTAVDPDFDIVEMGFDHYITKPVDREEINGAVNKLLERAGMDEREQKRQTMSLKKNILEDEAPQQELEKSEEYQSLNEELEKMDDKVDVDNDEVEDFFS